MKRYKNYLNKLNINLKKEITTAICFEIVVIAVTFLILFKFNYILAVAFILLSNLSYGLYTYMKYIKMEAIHETRKNESFKQFISLVIVNLSCKQSIYGAIKNTLCIENFPIKNEVTSLLSEINEDKTLLPYISFASKFSIDDAKNIMIILYQMSNDGSNVEYLNALKKNLDDLSIYTMDQIFRKREETLKSKGSLALIGSAGFVFALMIGIISLLGEVMSNGI